MCSAFACSIFKCPVFLTASSAGTDLKNFDFVPRSCAIPLTAIDDQVPAATSFPCFIALAFDTIKLAIVYAFVVFIDNDLPF